MGDSFFGFNTNLPPLTDEELRALTDQGKRNNDDDGAFDTLEEYGSRSNNREAEPSGNGGVDTPVDVDVYDFATLRHELGVDEYDDRDKEDNVDNLGDELIEEGDDLNDITFGDAPVGNDFDFSGNTKRLTTTLEEEAFFVKPKLNKEEPKKGGFLNPWADSSVRPSSGIGGSRGFGEPSPITTTKSIWGNFAGGFSSSAENTGFSSLSGSQTSNLSPFNSNANRQLLRSQQQPQAQPQQSQQPAFIGEGMSPNASLSLQQQQQFQQQGRPVTLEDLEANIQREQAAQRYHAVATANEQAVLGGKTTLSLAELEAALRSQQQQQPQQRPMPPHLMQQQPPPEVGMPLGFNQQPDPVQLLALKQQQEMSEQQLAHDLKRREQQQRKSKYDGLMTQHDKDLVNRIQLSQLASGDPYNDDFYYQVYSSLRQHAGIPLQTSQQQPVMGSNDGNTGSNNGRHHRGGRNREENTMQRMQQQLQRIVNEAKRRPKQSQVSLEGALGKITSLTVRNPRQVLQVPQTSNSSSTTENAKDSSKEDGKEDKAPTTSVSTPESEANGQPGNANRKAATNIAIDRRRVLMMTEQLYNLVLEIEQLGRQGPQRPPRQQQKQRDDDNNNADQAADEKALIDEFNKKLANRLEKLWNILRLNADPPQRTPDASMTTPPPSPPFVISLLSIAKGKKLIPRIVRQLNHEQILTLIKLCLSHFSQLQVCRYVIYPGTMVAQVDEAQRQMFVTFEEVETFMGAVVPPLLAFIAESPLPVVNGLLDLFLSHNPILAVAQTKPGLAFLTMLLSRAEILKQGGGQLQGLPPPTPEEVHHWQELYATLFNTLKGRYLTIFPSLYYLVPINPNTPMMQLSLAVDDMYVWQFLAAMAVGASMDQQHILVTEVRDRVMENIVLAKRNRLPMDQASHRISNVNLFLHALGLDASQVSVPL